MSAPGSTSRPPTVHRQRTLRMDLMRTEAPFATRRRRRDSAVDGCGFGLEVSRAVATTCGSSNSPHSVAGCRVRMRARSGRFRRPGQAAAGAGRTRSCRPARSRSPRSRTPLRLGERRCGHRRRAGWRSVMRGRCRLRARSRHAVAYCSPWCLQEPSSKQVRRRLRSREDAARRHVLTQGAPSIAHDQRTGWSGTSLAPSCSVAIFRSSK